MERKIVERAGVNRVYWNAGASAWSLFILMKRGMHMLDFSFQFVQARKFFFFLSSFPRFIKRSIDRRITEKSIKLEEGNNTHRFVKRERIVADVDYFGIHIWINWLVVEVGETKERLVW